MRIRSAAQALGVSSDWLRQLERTNVVARVPRDRNGHRRYTQEDIDRLRRFILSDRRDSIRIPFGGSGAPLS